MSEIDNLEVIKRGLTTYGGMQKTAGEWRMVCCPFHNDKSPSCGVYLRRDSSKRPLGFFNCFGCGAKGEWNIFAEKVGADSIKSWNSAESRVEYNTSKLDEELLSDVGLSIKSLVRKMDCPEAQPWPKDLDWRGFKGELIARVGGLVVNDDYNDSLAVLFPVRVANKIRGAVKAVYTKRYSTQLGYITMKGEWVSSYGLFPFDYTKKLIAENGYRFVILVEGPRDALRLIKLGLPAIAVLGANTFSAKKILYVTSLGVDVVYVMSDNDAGGALMWRNVKKICTVDTRRLKLPTEYDDKGKLIKMDPFNAPASIMNSVKSLMRERHGWEANLRV